MLRVSRRSGRLFWIPLSLLAAVALSSPLWLRGLGSFLISDQPPARADIAVALAGDGYGRRILGAADLVRRGYVPRVLVSGPEGNYGLHEDELAIPFAVRAGFPAAYFVPCRHAGKSTQEEAQIIVPALRRLGVHSFDLVTSDYHTRRAGRIFRAAAPDMRVTVVGVPNQLFDTLEWWRRREGRKTIFMEWTKTVTEMFGL